MAADKSIVLKGQLTTSAAMLQSEGSAYTVPTGRKLIITELCVSNVSSSAQTCHMEISGMVVVPNVSIPPNEGIVQERNTQVLEGVSIYGMASVNNVVYYYLSCLEVDA